MLNKHPIDSEEYYKPEFNKYATYEVVKQSFPFIGEIIAAFNSIENSINEDLIEYINDEIEDIGWIIIAEMSFSSKLNLWKKLISYLLSFEESRELKSKLKSDLDNLHKELNQLSQNRNKIAHADWDSMTETFFVKLSSNLDKENIKHHFLKVNEIEFHKVILHFAETHKKLIAFSGEVNKLL